MEGITPTLDKKKVGIFIRTLRNVFSPKQGVAEMKMPPGFSNWLTLSITCAESSTKCNMLRDRITSNDSCPRLSSNIAADFL
jgi:hypothetical protein